MVDIAVKNLTKFFVIGENLLEGLSFEIQEGECVAILGRNGCGKTTLLNILTGQMDYDDGEVYVNPNKRLGLISQIPRFPEGFTVEDVLRSAYRDLLSAKKKMEALEQQMFDLGRKRNMLRIGVPPMIGATYFPALYHAFHQKHPEIQVEIFEAGSLEMRKLIEREELDLALVITGTEPMTNYEALPLHNTEYVYCVGSHHRLADKAQITLAEVAEVPMILFQAGSVQIRAVREKLEAAGKRPNVLLYSSNVYTVCGYLKHYDAGAFLFPEVMEYNPGLKSIPLEEPWPVEIALMWKKNKQLYTDVTTFISFCKQYRK